MTYTPVIIKDAYREGNLRPIGKEPTADQSTEGLVLLNRLVAGVYGYEVGDPFFDWPVGTSDTVDTTSWTQNQWQYLLPNVRLIALQNTAQTLYLPPDPDDGARLAIVDPGNRLAANPITLDGNGRTIEGTATKVLNTDGLDSIWFYRADRGGWVLLSTLTGDVAEEFPFPEEFDTYFITKLAMRINPRYGRAMDEQSAMALERALRQLRARYRQQQVIPADLGVLNLTSRFGRHTTPRIVRGRLGWMN